MPDDLRGLWSDEMAKVIDVIMKKKRAPVASMKCVICLDQFDEEYGITCGNPLDSHFYCIDCFANMVTHQISMEEDGAFSKNQCKILCSHPECNFPFENKEITQHCDKKIFEQYLARQIDFHMREERVKMEKEYQARLGENLKKGELELKLDGYIHYITEEILTDKCPFCNTTLDFDSFDFEQCMAIKCVCGTQSCGWCHVACGSDAHPHVRSCPDNPMPNKNIFTTREKYFVIQMERKHKAIDEFIRDRVQEDLQEELKKVIASNPYWGIK